MFRALTARTWRWIPRKGSKSSGTRCNFRRGKILRLKKRRSNRFSKTSHSWNIRTLSSSIGTGRTLITISLGWVTSSTVLTSAIYHRCHYGVNFTVTVKFTLFFFCFPQVIFITEYMSSGSLKQFLKRTKRNVKKLPLSAWKRWCTQILSALR